MQYATREKLSQYLAEINRKKQTAAQIETERKIAALRIEEAEMEKEFDRSGFFYAQDNITYTIHVDAGHDGRTNALIPEITAWVRANGYNVTVKPDSYAASSIANKFSK